MSISGACWGSRMETHGRGVGDWEEPPDLGGGGVVGLQGREDNRDRRLYHNLQEGEVAVSGFEKAHSGSLGGLVH